MRGTTKTRDRMGLAEIGFDVIAITDIICVLPLAINNCDAVVIGSRPVPTDPGSRIPGLVAPLLVSHDAIIEHK